MTEKVTTDERCWAMLSRVGGHEGERCRNYISAEPGHPKLCARHRALGATIPDGWAGDRTPVFDHSKPVILTP